MIVWLLVSLVGAGPLFGKKKQREPEPEPVVAPEGTGADRALLPALVGEAESLEIEGLTRTAIRFTFSHDPAVLDQLDQEAVAALRHHLAADPTWRVTRLHGAWVAQRRADKGEGWTTGPDGYHVGEDRCWRIAVRLSDAPADHPWDANPRIAELSADTPTAPVYAHRLERGVCAGQRAVALVARGRATSLELFESGSGDATPEVQAALEELPIDLANAAIDSGLIARQGYDPGQLAAPLPSAPIPPTLSPRADGLELRATVHPSAPGTTWLRILSDGRSWEDATVRESTLEATGWSPDGSKHFPVQSRIPLTPEPFEATVELWYQPDAGAPELSASWTQTVGGRGPR